MFEMYRFDVIVLTATLKADDDSEASVNVTPTGRVVGVTQRNWRDYVVSLAQEEVCESS